MAKMGRAQWEDNYPTNGINFNIWKQDVKKGDGNCNKGTYIASRKFSLRLDLITDLGKRSPSFQRKHHCKRPKEIKKTQQMLKKKQRSIQKKPNKKRSLERRRNLSKKKH